MDMMYQGGTDWFSIISMIVNLLLGGGFIVSLLTIKAQKKTAEANAKQAEATAKSTDASAEGAELDNVSKAILIWQQSAEKSEARAQAAEQRAEAAEQRSQATADKYAKLAEEVSMLRTEVKKVTCTNQRILKILDSIDHENLEQKKQEAKDISA